VATLELERLLKIVGSEGNFIPGNADAA
jgi:hypothetical protein